MIIYTVYTYKHDVHIIDWSLYVRIEACEDVRFPHFATFGPRSWFYFSHDKAGLVDLYCMKSHPGYLRIIISITPAR